MTAPSTSKRKRSSDTKPDLWQLWFSRLIQIVGVVIVALEFALREHPRTIVVGTSLAFITGLAGIDRLAQWLAKR